MFAAVIGGGLQGVEAVYLAKKAGWDVLLIDKDHDIPAIGLCDRFVQTDVQIVKDLDPIFAKVDIVIPALENDGALNRLCEWKCQSILTIPFAFDWKAYQISSSKIRSNNLFADLKIPRPLPWPACGFPIIVKPSSGSGSKDMMIFNSPDALNKFAEMNKFVEMDKFYQAGKWVIQEYISGPSYSLEIIGRPDHYQMFQVTGLEMDAGYDCKRVIAPILLEENKISELEMLTQKIAHAINLTGIMDVEVIFHNGQLKVLEIDARLPSQTPMAVYHSTGINMVERLADLFLNTPQKEDTDRINKVKHVILEHIRVTPKGIYVEGEHIMKDHGIPLHVEENFFGVCEAITNYEKGCKEWVATLVISAKTPEDVFAESQNVITAIRNYFNIEKIVDINPY